MCVCVSVCVWGMLVCVCVCVCVSLCLWGMSVCVSVFLNLGLLATFKYLGFFVQSFNLLSQNYGLGLNLDDPNILLPIGISFYTFQTLSYTIDVYRKEVEPCKKLMDFMCFVSFFPQLVAGPIVRYKEFMPQLHKAKPLVTAMTISGLELILFGFFKKVVIADNIAPYVNLIYNDPYNQTGALLWFGSILFAIQIYADFSGYTDIARGLARILGFEFPQNFNWPYLSRSIQDFWRRWHMTLSFWIRDYLYFSLGGSRVKLPRYMLNMLITWLLMGLWHGASFTFILWGLYHGMLLIGFKVYKKLTPNFQLPKLIGIGITFTVVVLGWVPFRAQSTADALWIWGQMLSFKHNGLLSLLSSSSWVLWLGLALMCITHSLAHHLDYLNKPQTGALRASAYPVRLILVTLSMLTIILCSGPNQSFIYFAF